MHEAGSQAGQRRIPDEEETRAWLALALCAAGRPDSWLALARSLARFIHESDG
ncbi:MAG: hypothetical protein ABR538_02835 [Candidatus Binatia bacterium]